MVGIPEAHSISVSRSLSSGMGDKICTEYKLEAGMVESHHVLQQVQMP